MQETLKSITGQLLAFASPCAAEASFEDARPLNDTCEAGWQISLCAIKTKVIKV